MKAGDRVSVLNDVIRGTVLSVAGKQVTIETDEGFVLAYLKSELVVHHSDLDQGTPVVKKENKQSVKNKKGTVNQVIDLHFNHKNIPEGAILSYQISQFKKALNQAIRKHQSELTVIHGVGEGILKREIEKVLNQYKIPYSEAPFTAFGRDAALTVYLQGVKKNII